MEGDAGASRLNPPPMPIARRLRRLSRRPARSIHQESEASLESEVTAERPSPEATAEESSESEVGADQTGSVVTAEESSEASEPDSDSTEVTAEESEPAPDAGGAGVQRRPSRLGRGWLAGIAAALVVFPPRQPSDSTQRCRGAQGGGGLCFRHPGAGQQRDGRE